jgi:hypothetical protein
MDLLPSIILLVTIVLLLSALGFLYYLANKEIDNKYPNGPGSKIHWIIVFTCCIGFITLIIVTATIVKLFGGTNLYQTLAITLIISWLVILTGYYAWALYFYNINLGWSENDWERFHHDKEANPEVMETAPIENPFKEETLGLPAGTVRGTIALTLLIGALSITIAALSMDAKVKENELLIDNFDFFKKAFLMMIAFYFGTKSLEILQGTKSKPVPNEASSAPVTANERVDKGKAVPPPPGNAPIPLSQSEDLSKEVDDSILAVTNAETEKAPSIEALQPEFYLSNAKG